MSTIKDTFVRIVLRPIYEKLSRYLIKQDETYAQSSSKSTLDKTSKLYQYKILKKKLITNTIQQFDWLNVLKDMHEKHILYRGEIVGMDQIQDLAEDSLYVLIDQALKNGNAQNQVLCFEYNAYVQNEKICCSIRYVPYKAIHSDMINNVLPEGFSFDDIEE